MDAPGSDRPSVRLREAGLRPRKRLGQNFLRDRRYLSTIADAAEITAKDDVLEIGAGTGVLTEALAGRAARVVAVELDDSLAELLHRQFAGAQQVEVWHGNVLDFEPREHFCGPYKLVGNIPYYITGPIIRRFLELPESPQVLVLMVQREVAQRMVAAPGDLSLLGVSVQFYAQPKIVARVPRGAFYPPPKVDSAIVQLTPREEPVPGDLREDFFRVARAGFGTRRKTLSNALAIGLTIPREAAKELLRDAGIDPNIRAEELTIDAWARLATSFHHREEAT